MSTYIGYYDTLALYHNISYQMVEMTGVEPASKQDFPVSPTVYPEIGLDAEGGLAVLPSPSVSNVTSVEETRPFRRPRSKGFPAMIEKIVWNLCQRRSSAQLLA